MSKTFREFIEIVEGKKKQIERLKSAYLAGQQQAEPKIVNYGDSAPNSPERAAQIAAMMKDSGGGAIRKAIKQRERDAKKAANKLLKQQEAFSYGSKSFQQALKQQREKEAQKKAEERQQSANAARRAFRTKGIPFSDAKGKGHIVNGVKVYDNS